MEYSLYNEFPSDLEEGWNVLLDESISHYPFMRFEYQQIWWATRGGGEWPNAQLKIVTARKEGRLLGIAPLFLADHKERKALLLVGSIEISDYLDLIVRPADLDAFVSGLIPFLQAQVPGWQALDLYNILDSSPSLKALSDAAPKFNLQFTKETLQHSPYIPLPGDWETYLSGIDKKQRHEVRRKMRRAEESPVKVEWYITTDRARLEQDLQDFIALMEQDPEKAKFLTPEMCKQMLDAGCCAFENGCLQLAFLTIAGQKAAAYLNFDYLNRLWIYNSGFDQRFVEYSPGWVLLGHLLKWANENGRTEFDFMRGDEEYKYRFGAKDRFVMRAVISSPLTKGE